MQDLQTKTGRLFDAYPDLAREYAKKLHRKKEDIEFVQKFFVSEKAESVGAERAVISHITTESVDRDNEVLLPSGMKSERYEKSGKPVFWGHDYAEPRTVVGQCQWLKADPKKKGIIAKTAFRNTEFADEVYQLYTEDLTGQGPILNGFSVGFIPLEWETGKKDGDPRRTFTSWELLEYSFVSIPCNADAVTVLEQKGIKLCAQLRKDLGVPEKDTIVTEKGAAVAAGLDEKLDEKLGDKLGEVKAEVETPEIPETKEAAPVDAPAPDVVPEGDAGKLAVTISLTDDLKAALTALNARLDGIEARLAPPPVTPPVATPPNAPLPVINPEDVDIIDIEEAPDILDIEDAAPVAAPAPKSAALPAPASAPAITEADVLAAIERMDLKSIVKQYVDLALDKLRGRVR